MLKSNPFESRVTSCLLDFLGSHTPWHRRLWSVGSLLGIQEVLEGAEAVRADALSGKSFENLYCATEIAIGQDPGIGTVEERKLLQECLRKGPFFDNSWHLLLRAQLPRLRKSYLANWQAALRNGHAPKEQRTARLLAAHLLDEGFSAPYLHRWWTYRIRYEPEIRSLADLVEDAGQLFAKPREQFEVLLVLQAAPGLGDPEPQSWLDATQVSSWLREQGFDSRDLRQAGGFLLQVEARDVFAALERAHEKIERLVSRVRLGTRSQLLIVPKVWIRGEKAPLPLQRDGRGVEIRSLEREHQLYADASHGHAKIDAALDLVAPLIDGAPGPAVAGSWAALEAVLLGPGDTGERVVATGRIAALVACSYPRAELTMLAYAHMKGSQDDLAMKLRDADSNRERASLLAAAIGENKPPIFSSKSDQIALERMQTLLANPKKVLRDIEKYVDNSFRRLYRQRNLVLHWGRTQAIGLRASLRAVAPLLGAGLDRLVHAWLAQGTEPLELAARARLRLDLLEKGVSLSPVTLLES